MARNIIDVGRELQRHGWRVAENPAFGGVTPGVHSPKGYHPTGEAIDVTWHKSDTIQTPEGETISWQEHTRRAKDRFAQLGLSEVLGPGDKGHDTHLHLGWRGGALDPKDLEWAATGRGTPGFLGTRNSGDPGRGKPSGKLAGGLPSTPESGSSVTGSKPPGGSEEDEALGPPLNSPGSQENSMGALAGLMKMNRQASQNLQATVAQVIRLNSPSSLPMPQIDVGSIQVPGAAKGQGRSAHSGLQMGHLPLNLDAGSYRRDVWGGLPSNSPGFQEDWMGTRGNFGG